MEILFQEEKTLLYADEQYSIWLHKKLKILSFHQENDYDKLVFSDYKIMWEKVHELLGTGYRVC